MEKQTDFCNTAATIPGGASPAVIWAVVSSVMRTYYQTNDILVEVLTEVYELGHVIDPARYFLYTAGTSGSDRPADTIVLLDSELEATGGDGSQIQKLLDDAFIRVQWARIQGEHLRIPWIAEYLTEWEQQVHFRFETESLAFLQKRIAVWRALLAEQGSPVRQQLITTIEAVSRCLEPNFLQWLERQTLAWVRRLVEEDFDPVFAATLPLEKWRPLVQQYTVEDRPKRIELKSRAIDFVFAYAHKLTANAILELHLGNVESLDELRAGLDEIVISPHRRASFPRHLPQFTFMEARNLAIAIADGPFLKRWKQIQTEGALAHRIEDKPLQVRFAPAANPDFHATYDQLVTRIQGFNLSTVLLLNVAIGWVLQHEREGLLLDDLIKAIGWTPRSTEERRLMRGKLWEWLQAFDTMTVWGKRPGKYLDPKTRQAVDLTSEDALIKIVGKRFGIGDQSRIPIEVTWVAGPWLERFRGNSSVLQHFGDIQKIAGIASGKPSGSWAQSIGLALNQLWRERATQAVIRPTGEAVTVTAPRSVSVEFEPFTRMELLGLFRSEPWVEDILRSDKPGRAREYWNAAIKKLKGAGVIGSYLERTRVTESRQGWQDVWLHNQQLDIRPKEEAAKVIAKLARTAEKNQKHKV